jgi:integrase
MNTSEKEKRERGRGRIFARNGSALLWCAYYLRGKEHRQSTGETDPAKAEKFLNRKLKEVGADQIGAKTFVSPQQERIRTSALLDALETSYKIESKDSPQFKSHLKRIRDYFGPWRALEVTTDAVDRYITEQQESGCAAATINRGTQLLGQAFKLAVERKRLSSAPAIRHLSEKDNARQGFFAERELRAVVENLPDYLKDFTLFGFSSGWRSGEIKSLTWEDVDGDCIRLRSENSKNGEGRVIVLEGELANLMERRKAARVVETAAGPVLSKSIFHNGAAEPIGDIRKAWQSACCMVGVGKMVCPTCTGTVEALPRCATCSKRSCVECSKLHCSKCSKNWKREELKYAGKLFHDLRRSSVRNMIRAGVSEKVAMTLSGHKTHSMLSRYNIVNETDQRQALRRTQDYLKSAVEESKVVAMPARVQ